ncbi:MAG: hypothetical protein ACRDTB_00055 [Actinophytocola sp.]
MSGLQAGVLGLDAGGGVEELVPRVAEVLGDAGMAIDLRVPETGGAPSACDSRCG